MDTNKNRKLVIVAGGIGLAALLGLGIWIALGPDASEGRNALDFESRLQKAGRDSDDGYREQFGSQMPIRNPDRLIQQMGFSRKALEAHYKLFYRYPPNSRPLNSDMEDLLDPFRMHTSPQAVFAEGDADRTKAPVAYYQFFAPRHAIAGDQTFTAWLQVHESPGMKSGRLNPFRSADRIAPVIESAQVLSDVSTGRVVLGNAEFNDDGMGHDRKKGDGVYTFSWKPAARTRLNWGELTLLVRFKVQGKPLHGSITFSSTPETPGGFTGNFREELRNGSLVIRAEMNVTEPGYYILEANLFHKASGDPTHFVIERRDLRKGLQDVEFTFFGKIFHDKEMEGHFELRHLRGFRHNILLTPQQLMTQFANPKRLFTEQQAKAKIDEPLHQYMVAWDKPYQTQKYTLNDFSQEEYDGQDKRTTMEGIRGLKGSIPETADNG